MNKKLFWYDNSKIIIASVLFFVACFVILNTAVRINAEDTVEEFTLSDNADSVSIAIHTELDNDNSIKSLSGVGIKMAEELTERTGYYTGYDYKFKDFLVLDKNGDSYEIKGHSDYEVNATQMRTDANGDVKITKIPKGYYLIYESEIAEENVSLFTPIEIKVEDSDGKLKVSVDSKENNIDILQNDDNITITLKHKLNSDKDTSSLSKHACLARAATGGGIFAGIEGALKLEKEVYPPSVKEWNTNFKVEASIFSNNFGYLISPGKPLIFSNYCSNMHQDVDSYVEYLEKEHSEEYNEEKIEIGEQFKEYYEEYKKYSEEHSDRLSYYNYYLGNSVSDWWNRGGYFYYLDENDNIIYYSINNENTYNEYLVKYFDNYYSDYEKPLKEEYGDEYDEYLTRYGIVNLSKKTLADNGVSLNNSMEWASCFGPDEYGHVTDFSGDQMDIDIYEVSDNDDYVVSFYSNVAGLTQEGNRFYGTVNGVLGHEIDVKVVNWDKNYGDLQITKKLFGEDKKEKTDKEFKFKVEFTLPNEKTMDSKLLYTLNGGTEYKELTVSGDSTKVVSFNLKAGDTIRLVGIPTGTTYKVTEEDNKEYNVKTENENGAIEGAKINEVMVINTEGNLAPDDVDLYDSVLVVSKNVIGEIRDVNKSFKFTVTLSDKNINGQYGEMKFENGVATFDLKDGESIKTINIPDGTTYEVSEKTDKDFVINKENDTGTVENGKEIIARFTNMRKNVLPNTADSIIIVIIVALISLGTLIYFQVNKKYMI